MAQIANVPPAQPASALGCPGWRVGASFQKHRELGGLPGHPGLLPRHPGGYEESQDLLILALTDNLPISEKTHPKLPHNAVRAGRTAHAAAAAAEGSARVPASAVRRLKPGKRSRETRARLYGPRCAPSPAPQFPRL